MRTYSKTMIAGVVGFCVLLGPYVVGAVYAVLALPVYSIVCKGSRTAYASGGGFLDMVNVSEGDYRAFLFNRGCSDQGIIAQQPGSSQESNPLATSLGSIDDSYRSVHQYFNDDFLGNFIDNGEALTTNHFVVGVNTGAWILLAVVRLGVIFTAFLYLLYAAVAIVAIQMVNIAVQSVAHKLRT